VAATGLFFSGVSMSVARGIRYVTGLLDR